MIKTLEVFGYDRLYETGDDRYRVLGDLALAEGDFIDAVHDVMGRLFPPEPSNVIPFRRRDRG